ncbi:hypothetical protein D9619_013336 [Psilocybe cf. subviscida]|uniref:Uncharacterized protein n=1 Tax=Psilocybe cf. subviscida TaxID=2480587 RepID=A0A8H5BRS4_9AGAR|nr:hypothetical protein D9619_013336 [Psilocybe cf. subviscida]
MSAPNVIPHRRLGIAIVRALQQQRDATNSLIINLAYGTESDVQVAHLRLAQATATVLQLRLSQAFVRNSRVYPHAHDHVKGLSVAVGALLLVLLLRVTLGSNIFNVVTDALNDAIGRAYNYMAGALAHHHNLAHSLTIKGVFAYILFSLLWIL